MDALARPPWPTLTEHRRRAGLARAAKYAHVIDGQLVTTRQAATRLGISPYAAAWRIKNSPHPLTWAGLQRGKRHGSC